jgi:hypothetical protein
MADALSNLTVRQELASRYPPSLRFKFKPTVHSLRAGWLSGGPRAWPCLRNGRWPREAHAQEKHPPRIWIVLSKSTVCIVGFGWANRAEQTAAMLMRGMLALHDRLARSSAAPSAFRLKEFKHTVSINLLDWYQHGWSSSSHPSQLAYACKGDRPGALTPSGSDWTCTPSLQTSLLPSGPHLSSHPPWAGACNVGLVPNFLFEHYLETGVGEFPDLSRRLAAAGSRPARRRVCGWAGNLRNHEQRGRFARLADLHPHLLARGCTGVHLPLEAQVEEWACLVNLVGFGFSARVPLLLHSGRVLLKVTGGAAHPASPCKLQPTSSPYSGVVSLARPFASALHRPPPYCTMHLLKPKCNAPPPFCRYCISTPPPPMPSTDTSPLCR